MNQPVTITPVLKNDCLEKNPNLTPHVLDILVKFRTYLTGLLADIDKAFHQIEIDPCDQK